MRSRLPLAAVAFGLLLPVLVCGAVDSVAPPDSSATRLSFEDYQRELARIDNGLQSLPEHPDGAEDLRRSIPPKWQVRTPSGNFEIDNSELCEKLETYTEQSERRAEVLPEMELKIEAAIDGAKEFNAPVDSSARSKLDQILEGREFRGVVKTQSPLEKIKDWLMARAIRILSKIFRVAFTHPQASKIFLWSLIGTLVIAFCAWIVVLLRGTARDEYTYPRDGDFFLPSSKHWQQWLRDARQAADRGEWRNAVHLAYWAGISYLESSGVWKPDRARTPREYLRLLKESNVARPALDALTRRFEFIWYAQQPASSEDFQFSLAQLEKMGCR
jgi:hypothetical protein